MIISTACDTNEVNDNSQLLSFRNELFNNPVSIGLTEIVINCGDQVYSGGPGVFCDQVKVEVSSHLQANKLNSAKPLWLFFFF